MHDTVRFLRAAEHDVAEIVAYLADDNPTVAQRFRDALQETATVVLGMPRIGSARVSDMPALKDIRIVPMRDFEKYFVFYRIFGGGIQIVRVLHGARDYPALFG